MNSCSNLWFLSPGSGCCRWGFYHVEVLLVSRETCYKVLGNDLSNG
jgi:hypothetical protein